jgi:hypothetical protein
MAVSRVSTSKENKKAPEIPALFDGFIWVESKSGR